MRGPVIGITHRRPESIYLVFIDGVTQTLYASQLEPEETQTQSLQHLSISQFHCYLTALQIRHPSLSSLYSLNSARIDFIPYQYRPVFKFIRSDRPRLLIADGVGVGKTIEAGLILQELQARRDIQSVLIICPRPLVMERKWKNEMKRFGEHFVHLDGQTLRYCLNEMDLDGVWPDQYRKVIIPYSLFDEVLLLGTSQRNHRTKRKGLLQLNPPPRFDLVIVDEAHHIRNTETYSHKAVRFFCDNAEAALFLTATPVQLGSSDLYVLLNVLRPDLVVDQRAFEQMAEPNPSINRAIVLARSQQADWADRAYEALEVAVKTSWGQAILKHNPGFQLIESKLREGEITDEERVALIKQMEELHTFSGIISRTRRRDIGQFTVRNAQTVPVHFTEEQRALHDGLLSVQASILGQLHNDANVKFMMTTLRRQAASCIYGLAPLIEDILARHMHEPLVEEYDTCGEASSTDILDKIDPLIRGIIEQARSLTLHDPKLDALKRLIQEKQDLPNNKVMLFSSFRHTLSYIYERLREDGYRVGLVHGGTPDEQREEMRNRFESPRQDQQAIDVLLFSEIGCEGLDYQFCDCIVNYDLPWNPMRIEQRIGRIDRNGQKSETVAIYNMITPGTVDADIYERCLLRIGVFKDSIGDNEEILGEITRGIRAIADDFALSEQERQSKLQQLADNEIRLLQEQQALEEKQVELFGVRLTASQFSKEIEEATSYWLAPHSIQRLVESYLGTLYGKDQQFVLGDKPLKTLRLSQDARSRLLEDFDHLEKPGASVYREWEKWLKGGVPTLPVTFASDCAAEHSEAVLITPIHPLVRQAATAFDLRRQIAVSLRARSSEVPAGTYHFAIYQWQFHGMRYDMVLCPVAQFDSLSKHLMDLLKGAEEWNAVPPGFVDEQIQEDLDAQHYRLWSEACEQHKRRTRDLCEHRRESLTTSHQARIALLEEYLESATEANIQRMRRSQLASAHADYERRIEEIQEAIDRADITSRPVAFGILELGGEQESA